MTYYRQLIFNHRQALLESMTSETDPAMLLHLASVVLFQTFTQAIIHVPGRCVPQVITFLKQHMEDRKYVKLVELQGNNKWNRSRSTGLL